MLKLIKKIFYYANTDKQNIELIRNSGYFDKDYYALENPDIKGDLCKHYYYFGWKEGRSPSYNFSNDFYLNNYKDVADSKINPLLHYIKFGKAENRLIDKDNGLSLKKIYEKLYQCPYFYKTYICDNKTKRVNLFFDEINENIEEIIDYIYFTVEFCRRNDYQLRIIYYKADLGILKKALIDNNIEIPVNTSFLNLKSSNYLDVGLDEKYICTSWKNARALLNTASINTNIYLCFDGAANLSLEDYYQVSNICFNDHIICLVKDENVLKDIKKCQLRFETNSVLFSEQKQNQLYCDFGNMFITGIEILNETFLDGTLDSGNWEVNIIEDEKFKFHFDTNVKVRAVNEIKNDANLVFRLAYKKHKEKYTCAGINAWVEETEFTKEKYINIKDDKGLAGLLDITDFSPSKIDNCYMEFNNSILSIKKER